MVADEEVRDDAEEALRLLDVKLLFGRVGCVGNDLELNDLWGDFESDGLECEALAGEQVAGEGCREEALPTDGEVEGTGGDVVEEKMAVGGGEGLLGGVGLGELDAGVGDEGALRVDEGAGEGAEGGVGRGSLCRERESKCVGKQAEDGETAQEGDAATDGLARDGQRTRHYERLTSIADERLDTVGEDGVVRTARMVWSGLSVHWLRR